MPSLHPSGGDAARLPGPPGARGSSLHFGNPAPTGEEEHRGVRLAGGYPGENTGRRGQAVARGHSVVCTRLVGLCEWSSAFLCFLVILLVDKATIYKVRSPQWPLVKASQVQNPSNTIVRPKLVTSTFLMKLSLQLLGDTNV